MKKIFAVVLFAALTATAAFAVPEFRLSAGAGGMFNLNLVGHQISATGATAWIYNPAAAGGGFVFFDATYAEVSLGFSGGSTIFQAVNSTTTFSVSQLNIGFLLKYPFGRKDSFKIFPLLGIEYMATLSVKDEDGKKIEDVLDYKASDFSSMMIKLGFGMDFSLTEQIYLRPSLLLGIRLPSTFETKIDELLVGKGEGMPVGGAYVKINFAAGYRF